MDSREVWNKFEKGKSYQDKKGIKTKTEKNWKFYIGEQWSDPADNKGEAILPIKNFIKPVVKYKVSTIAQHTVTAVFSDMNEGVTEACDNLGKLFDISWEKSNMDRIAWKSLNNCAIAGDSYVFWYDGDTRKKPQILHNTQVYLGDENNINIQEQPYIIIEERLELSVARDRARHYGCTEDEVREITVDSDTTEQLFNKDEVSDKVTSLLYMTKKDGVVNIMRTTKNVVYDELHEIKASRGMDREPYGDGLSTYPILSMIWEEKPNTARGVSEVEQMIPNQIIANKVDSMRYMANKLAAYPRLAVAEGMVANPEDLEKVGSTLFVNGGNAQAVSNMIAYLAPMSQSPDAKTLSDELLQITKDLAGASDTAMGNINLSRVSGTAITMVRDQQQVPLNEQVAMFKEFVENVAMLYFDLWKTYYPEGVNFDEVEVTAEEINGILPNVRIDVSENNTWSKVAEQQEISNLFNNNKITFEEYAQLMPDHTSIPKDALLDIVAQRQRKQQEQEQQMAQMQQQQQAPVGEEPIDNSVEQEIPDNNVGGGGVAPQQIQEQLATEE